MKPCANSLASDYKQYKTSQSTANATTNFPPYQYQALGWCCSISCTRQIWLKQPAHFHVTKVDPNPIDLDDPALLHCQPAEQAHECINCYKLRYSVDYNNEEDPDAWNLYFQDAQRKSKIVIQIDALPDISRPHPSVIQRAIETNGDSLQFRRADLSNVENDGEWKEAQILTDVFNKQE